MRNSLFLLLIGFLLSGCLGDAVLGGGEVVTRPQHEAFRNAETGETIKMWIPNGMQQTAAWPFQARGEESHCSNGYYLDKNDWDLLPSQRTIYKVLKNGDRVWAYYYGENTPGFDVTDWYITVFNIYANSDGKIYACYWGKFPGNYRLTHGTLDGINPNIHSPR